MGTATQIAEQLNAQPLDERVEQAYEQFDNSLTESEDLAHGKWNGWVRKIDDPYKQAVTAQALENQEAYIHSLPRQMIHETTLMGDPGIAVNPDLAFPLIRAIMPNLAATELFATFLRWVGWR